MALATLLAAPARADQVGNLNQTDPNDGTLEPFLLKERVITGGFRTGNHADGYTIESLSVRFDQGGHGKGDAPIIHLFNSDLEGRPTGGAIGVLNSQKKAETGVTTFSASIGAQRLTKGVPVDPNKNYAFQLLAGMGNSTIEPALTRSTSQDGSTSTHWSTAGSHVKPRRARGSGDWEEGPGRIRFQINARKGGGRPPERLPKVEISDAETTEGEGDLTFTVTMDKAAKRRVEIAFSVLGAGATAGSDYHPVFGLRTFQAGETTTTITVEVIDDEEKEETEEVWVEIARVDDQVEIIDDTGVGRILDDDAGPPLTAEWSGIPREHRGEEFTFRLDFSDEIAGGFRAVKSALQVKRGRTKRAQRVTSGSNKSWDVTIDPTGKGRGAIEMTLSETTDCEATGAICTSDGRMLSNSLHAVSRGALNVAIYGSRVQEEAGAVLRFPVRLNRVTYRTVTVDYRTVDETAESGTGKDYTAKSGTLTFNDGDDVKYVEVEVLADFTNEGNESMRVELSNATNGLVITEDRARGLIMNDGPIPATLVARFGRSAAVHVVEQIEQRVGAARDPGVEGRIAGFNLESRDVESVAAQLAGRFGGNAGYGYEAAGAAMASRAQSAPGNLPGPAGLGPQDVPMTGATPGTMLHNGGSLAGGMLGGAEVTVNQPMKSGTLAFWSRGARSHFSGSTEALRLGGDVDTTMVGADYTRGRLLAGLSLSHSRGLGEYEGADSGTVMSSVTGLYPWVGWRASDRMSMWGVGGYGTGGLLLRRPEAGPQQSGLSLAMTAAGARGALIDRGNGFELAFKADALWVGTRVHGSTGPHGNLSPDAAGVTRVRSALETADTWRLGMRMTLRPSLEVGIRRDGGDAEVGAGLDVGGGLVLADGPSGLQVDVRVRRLVMHEADGFAEHGFSVAVSYDPRPSTPLGLRATVAPAWGGDSRSSAEALWAADAMRQAGYREPVGDRLDAQVGYGLPLGSRLVGTPQVGVTTSRWGRDLRFGYAVGTLTRENLAIDVGVDAQVRGNPLLGGADKGVLARAAIGW